MEDHSHAATATVYYFPLGGEPLSFFLWASALKRLVGSPYEMWRRRIMVDPASCIIELTIFLTATRKRQTTDMSAGLERMTVYVRRTLYSCSWMDGAICDRPIVVRVSDETSLFPRQASAGDIAKS